MYFSNSHAIRDLPIPGTPTIESRCARPSSAVAWNSSLTRRSSRSRPRNGGSRPAERPSPFARSDHPERTPERLRLGLALELVLAGVRVGDRGLRCPLRRLADEDAARLRLGLDPGGGVDEVAGNHALSLGAEGDRGLAGEDAGTRLQLRVERGNRGDELQRGSHGAFGVVLLRDGRSPHRHHRVADELLHRPAVALDERARLLEVAGEELARLLRVAALGGGGEADEVGEEDGHVAALRGGCRGGPAVPP